MGKNNIPNFKDLKPMFPHNISVDMAAEIYRAIVENRLQYWEICGKCEPGEVVEKALDDTVKIYTAVMSRSETKIDRLRREILDIRVQNEEISKRIRKQLFVSICGEIIILIGLLLILML